MSVLNRGPEVSFVVQAIERCPVGHVFKHFAYLPQTAWFPPLYIQALPGNVSPFLGRHRNVKVQAAKHRNRQ